ncbi:M57 family metalloprotease [Pedobacter sp. MW01-1-1]|uniref:M57 family metalloprotease n=1 Tax=Pedobacter sp. MW01-1-1 TaxID=3383027 RepID=UPI003FEDAA70
MRKKIYLFSLVFLLFACQKKENLPQQQNEEISKEELKKIEKKGFSTNGIQKIKGGYIVEGDIFISKDDLEKNNSAALKIGETEQYRTNNLIRNTPRTITISVTSLPEIYTTATDISIARYNALNLRLTFQRVANNGNINIVGDTQLGSLGRSAGFPSNSGDPASPITLNPNRIGSNPDIDYLATIIAHEIGHCIGLRHTDYFNRQFSCGVYTQGNNEGFNNNVVKIPGTPSSEDAGSYMLACIGPNQNVPFNPNDVIALNYLYGGLPVPEDRTVSVSIFGNDTIGLEPYISIYFYEPGTQNLVYWVKISDDKVTQPVSQKLPIGWYDVKVKNDKIFSSYNYKWNVKIGDRSTIVSFSPHPFFLTYIFQLHHIIILQDVIFQVLI